VLQGYDTMQNSLAENRSSAGFHVLFLCSFFYRKANVTTLPCLWHAGGVQYMPVEDGSFLNQVGARWMFPAFTITLGSSYFQRLLAALPHLAEAVRKVPSFGAYCPYLPVSGQVSP
jgi:hypothetical protein